MSSINFRQKNRPHKINYEAYNLTYILKGFKFDL